MSDQISVAHVSWYTKLPIIEAEVRNTFCSPYHQQEVIHSAGSFTRPDLVMVLVLYERLQFKEHYTPVWTIYHLVSGSDHISSQTSPEVQRLNHIVHETVTWQTWVQRWQPHGSTHLLLLKHRHNPWGTSSISNQICILKGFPGGAIGKEPACQCRKWKRCRFNLRVGKIPWRRAWQPTPVLLHGEFHGQRSLVGYSPWDCKELDMTEGT